MLNPGSYRRTADEWEESLGRDLRALRLSQNRSQSEVAREANVSEDALRSLERGEGSRVRTLIQVARALGREEWLASVAPPEPTISPLAMLRDSRHAAATARVRASRTPPTGP